MSVNLLYPGATPQRRDQLSLRSKALLDFRAQDLTVALTATGGAALTTFTTRGGGTGYFSRSTVGLWVGRGGLLGSAPANFPALNYDLANEAVGLLLGGARTSLVSSLDISGWTDIGTPATAAVPSGPGAGITGYAITDNDAGAAEGELLAITFTGNAVKAVAVCVKFNSAAASSIVLRDTSAGADRLNAVVTWSGTNPGTPATTAGTYLAKFQLADGWWLLLFATSSVTAANTNQIWLFGATQVTTTTGTTLYAAPGAWNATFPFTPQTAALAQTADSLYFDFRAKPQAMTGYFRFIERGTVLANLQRLCHIGLTAEDTDPRLQIAGTGSAYAMTHSVSTVGVASTLSTGPTLGQLVELRAELYADGSVQLHQSIAEEAETSATASAANTLATAWAGERLYLNSDPAGGNLGFTELQAAAWVPGTGHTMAALRRRFA